MKKYTKFLLASLVGAATFNLMSCSSSSDSSNGPGPNPGPKPVPTNKDLQVGNIGIVPTNSKALGAAYPLTLLNNSDKVINLLAVKSSGVQNEVAKNTGGNDAQLFDWSGCKKIQPHGSCTIQIKSSGLIGEAGKGATGQYAINITSQAEGGKQSYTDNQVIGYQNFSVTQNQGIYYNTSQATTTNVTSNKDSMSVTIPVYFNKAYSNVSVAGSLDANLVGCGIPNKDGSYDIHAGSSCALVTTFQGGKKFNSSVQLVENLQKVSQKSNNKKSVQNNTNNIIMNVNIVNSVLSQAMVTAAVATSFLPTDGTQLTVNYTNIGSAAATINSAGWTYNGTFIAYSGSPQTVIGSGQGATTVTGVSNTCTGTIAAGNGCAITFMMNGDVNSGDLYATVNYNTGLSTNTASAYYNVYFNAPTNTGVLSSQITNGQLTGGFIGSELTATVTVTNQSTTNTSITLSNAANLVTVGNPPKPASISITNNTCTSGAALAQGGSCNYTVTYTPTESSNGTIYNLYGSVSGTYSNLGQTLTVNSGVQLPYSASTDSTYVTFNPNQLQMVVPSGQTVTESLVMTNTTSGSTVDNIVFDDSVLPAGASIIANTCASPTQLSYNQSCYLTFEYAPSAVASAAPELPVDFDITTTGTVSTQDVVYTNFEATAGASNLTLSAITPADNNLPSGAPTSTGTGEDQNNPISFYNYGNSLRIVLTYKNIGTGTAGSLAIDANSLPTATSGYTVTDGCTGQTLAQNATCNVTLTTMSPSVTQSLTYNGSLDFVIPTMTYTEAGVRYVRNTFTTPNGGDPMVWVNNNPAIIPSVSVGQGSLVQVGESSFYVLPVAFENTANIAQAVNIPLYAPAPSLASPYGFSDSATVPPAPSSGGATTVPLAGQATATKYLWFPSNGSSSQSFGSFYYYPNYGSNNYTISQVFVSNPAVGVTYTSSGNVITATWTNLGSFYSTGTTIDTETVGTGSITQLIQNQGYLYSLNDDIYSMPITAWQTTTGSYGDVYYPDITANTGTGSLGNVTSQSLGYTPGTMSIGTVSGTTYAAVGQSGSNNLYVYTVATGTFTNISGPDALTSDGSTSIGSITSVAVGQGGDLYVTNNNKQLYVCGTVTNVNTTCTSQTLPSFTPTNLTGVSVAANGGYVVVTPQYSASYTGGATPTAQSYYSADDGDVSAAWTALSPNQAYVNAKATELNYNLTPGVFNPLVASIGSLTSWNSLNSSYSYTPTLASWSTTSTPATYLTGTSYSSGSTTPAPFAYYSFMPVNGQY